MNMKCRSNKVTKLTIIQEGFLIVTFAVLLGSNVSAEAITTTTNPSFCPEASACIHWNDRYICANPMATCENMKCVCRKANYDLCSCLPHVDTCQIQYNSGNSAATASYEGATKSLNSCTPSTTNPNYNVHVIGNYENINGRTGTTIVDVGVENPDPRPVIIVFSSYEPVNWNLNIPDTVVIDTVVLISYYLDNSLISLTREGSVQNIIRHPDRSLVGYGSDSGGGNTAGLLEYVVQQYGSIASFTGCYKADYWNINIVGTAGLMEDFTPSKVISTAITTTTSPPFCQEASACDFWNNMYICADSMAKCENKKCVCREANYDLCSCLPDVDTCQIQQNSANPVAKASYEGVTQSLYSCTPSTINPNYNVHVIGNYESNGHSGFRVHNTGKTTVDVEAGNPDPRPVIIVFSSYEPVNLTLNVPDSVVIDTVVLISYYLDNSFISVTREGSVQNIIRHPDRSLFGFGSDSGGGHTADLLEYVVQQYGSIASFTGCYRADHWDLNIVGSSLIQRSTATSAMSSTLGPTGTTPSTISSTRESTESPTENSTDTVLLLAAASAGGGVVLVVVIVIFLFIRCRKPATPDKTAVSISDYMTTIHDHTYMTSIQKDSHETTFHNVNYGHNNKGVVGHTVNEYAVPTSEPDYLEII